MPVNIIIIMITPRARRSDQRDFYNLFMMIGSTKSFNHPLPQDALHLYYLFFFFRPCHHPFPIYPSPPQDQRFNELHKLVLQIQVFGSHTFLSILREAVSKEKVSSSPFAKRKTNKKTRYQSSHRPTHCITTLRIPPNANRVPEPFLSS